MGKMASSFQANLTAENYLQRLHLLSLMPGVGTVMMDDITLMRSALAGASLHGLASWPGHISKSPQLRERRVETSIDIVCGELRAIAESKDALQAIKDIERVLNRVDDAASLAESRLRILLGQTQPPHVAERPGWLANQLEGLREEFGLAGSVTIEESPLLSSVDLLVRATIRATGDATHDIDMCLGPVEGIEIDWQTEDGLRWIVYPPRLQWPGVHVRAYRRDPTSREYRAVTFFSAANAIEHACKSLKNS